MRLRLGVAAHLHALGREDRRRSSAGTRRATPRATSRPSLALQGLYFCVLALSAILHRHVEVGRVVDVDVAVAVQVLDDRHLGLAADALDQALAAARDDHVDVLRHGDQLAHGLAVGGLHQLHRLGRQAGLGQRLLHQPRQRLVRFDRFRAAAQDAALPLLIDRLAASMVTLGRLS